MTEHARKLLIVEDDPGLLNQLKWCFEDYEVFTAENREDAIAELRRHEPCVGDRAGGRVVRQVKVEHARGRERVLAHELTEEEAERYRPAR